MTDQERRNLEAVKRWEETYNDDLEALVDEVYASDCEVVDVLRGVTLRGREKLRAFERRIAAAAPGRRIQVLRAVASGQTVAVECEGHFPTGTIPVCAFLVFDESGRVTQDRTYAGTPPTAARNSA